MGRTTTARVSGRSPHPLWRRWPASFWRAAAAAGLAAMALGLMEWSGPRISAPGFAPLGLLALALILSGPPRAVEKRSRHQSISLTMALLGLLLPMVVAPGFIPEPEAAILTLPYWSAVLAFLLLGWRFRQQDGDLPVLTVGAMAVVGLILSFVNEGPSARVWWAVSLVWIGCVVVLGGSMRRKLEDSPPLLGAAGWFALAVAALTIQEFGNASVPTIPNDFQAALAAWKAQPALGWGLGSFDRVFSEYSLRLPTLAPSMTKGGLRLLVEVGIVAAALMALGLLGGFATTITTRPWDRSRVLGLGLAGLWIMATLSVRHTPMREFFVAAIILPSAFGRIPPPERYESEDFIPAMEWPSWAGALLLVAGFAFAWPAAQWHYDRQDPRNNLEASALLPYWSTPLRNKAWHLRTRWEEVEQFTDPAKRLIPVIEDWLACAPHDEYAHLEALRLAARRPAVPWADLAVQRAEARIPWSDSTAAWIVRVRLEQGRPAQALEYLGDLRRRRGGLSPVLQQEALAILSGRNREDLRHDP